MNHLLRDIAPITDAGWAELEDEARRQLIASLAARKLVDFSGPRGWQHSATNLGRIETVDTAVVEGVAPIRRRVLPLVEPRVPFTLARAELDDIARGAEDADLDALDQAARRIALAENVAVFNGWAAAGITGITEASPHQPIGLTDDLTTCPGHIHGPVRSCCDRRRRALRSRALARGLQERDRDDRAWRPALRPPAQIVDGPLALGPGVDGAIVASLRGGGIFLFECGQDIGIAL